MRIVVKNLPQRTTQEELRAFFAERGKVTDVCLLKSKKGVFRRVAFVGFQTGEEAAAASDWFHEAMFKNHKIAIEMAEEEVKPSVLKTESQERRILYSKTVLVRNLSSEVDIELLRLEFEKVGKILDIRVEQNKNAAVIQYRDGQHALTAYKTVRVVLGMRVRVCAYNEAIVKKQKQHYSTLFFNFDSIIKKTCESERIDKRDLINLKDPSLGSRIALLEADLVEQTKQFLKLNGIYIDCTTTDKSKHKLIVRNSDILGLLDAIQGEYQIAIAPSRCLAILTFTEPQQASAALKQLNMRRHNNQIIYCEFAPICTAPEHVDTQDDTTDKIKSNKLVVKNVPFQATAEDLRSIFSQTAHVVDVRLPLKNDGGHRGFGFVILDSPANAKKTLAYFGASTHLFGRRLVLEIAKQ